MTLRQRGYLAEGSVYVSTYDLADGLDRAGWKYSPSQKRDSKKFYGKEVTSAYVKRIGKTPVVAVIMDDDYRGAKVLVHVPYGSIRQYSSDPFRDPAVKFMRGQFVYPKTDNFGEFVKEVDAVFSGVAKKLKGMKRLVVKKDPTEKEAEKKVLTWLKTKIPEAVGGFDKFERTYGGKSICVTASILAEDMGVPHELRLAVTMMGKKRYKAMIQNVLVALRKKGVLGSSIGYERGREVRCYDSGGNG